MAKPLEAVKQRISEDFEGAAQRLRAHEIMRAAEKIVPEEELEATLFENANPLYGGQTAMQFGTHDDDQCALVKASFSSLEAA